MTATIAKGSNATRARALARSPRRPRFALGALVKDRYGEVGAISAAYADLEAAADGGAIDDPADWLKVQEQRPKTSRKGIWYTVVLGDGEVLCGEDDLT